MHPTPDSELLRITHFNYSAMESDIERIMLNIAIELYSLIQENSIPSTFPSPPRPPLESEQTRYQQHVVQEHRWCPCSAFLAR